MAQQKRGNCLGLFALLLILGMGYVFYSLLSSGAKQCKAEKQYTANHTPVTTRFVSWQDYSIKSKVYSTVNETVPVFKGEKGSGVFFINCQRYDFVGLDSLLVQPNRGLLVNRNGRVSIVQSPELIAPQ